MQRSWTARLQPGKLLVHTLLILGVIPMVYPFIHMVMTSLMTPTEALSMPPALVPAHPQWHNYVEAFTTVPFGRFLYNSVVVTGLVVCGQLFTSCLGGYAFARLHFKGREALFLVYLGVLMVPMHVTLIPNFVLMKYLGWIDSLTALVVPSVFSAVGIFLLRQAFRQIPTALIEAASIDGCNPWQCLWYVALPLVKPFLAALAINVALWKWNDFLWPLLVLKTPAHYVLSIGIQYFQDQHGLTNWPLMMAATTVAQLPILLAFIFAQKSFVAALTNAGLKF